MNASTIGAMKMKEVTHLMLGVGRLLDSLRRTIIPRAIPKNSATREPSSSNPANANPKMSVVTKDAQSSGVSKGLTFNTTVANPMYPQVDTIKGKNLINI